jgi:hypothetical protein
MEETKNAYKILERQHEGKVQVEVFWVVTQ